MKAAEVSSPAACCVPLTAADLTHEQAEATAAVFKALADPNRVRIVNLVVTASAPVCVCDLTEQLGIGQPTVSHHLKRLVEVGLLEREQRGTWAYFSVNPAALDRLAGLSPFQGATR